MGNSLLDKKNLKAALNERLRIILLRFKRKTRQAKDHSSFPMDKDGKEERKVGREM